MKISITASSKIEKNCTATMKVVQADNGVSVNVCYTHYGHEIELQHVRLTKKERSEIAAKLQMGISAHNILGTVRDEVGSEFQRIHLLEKKTSKIFENRLELR